MIIYVSDFSGSSGYDTLSRGTCNELVVTHGVDLMVIGINYNRKAHFESYPIVPADNVSEVPLIIKTLVAAGVKIEVVFVAMDIPVHIRMLNDLGSVAEDIPYVGIFPLEAEPLGMKWAFSLKPMRKALVMTDFGRDELVRYGINAEKVSFSPANWGIPPAGEDYKAEIRERLDIGKDEFVVLMVATNQERKNLDAAMSGFSLFLGTNITERNLSGHGVRVERKVKNARMILVTNPDAFLGGYDLSDMQNRYGISDVFKIYKNVSSEALQALYMASDTLLISSKAEGLCLPMLEAFHMRLPVIGTNCTAIAELGRSGRALLADVAHTVLGTFGNGARYYVSPESIAEKLRIVYNGVLPDTEQAFGYVTARRGKASAKIAETIQEVTNG